MRWTRVVPPGGVGEVVLKQQTRFLRHGRSAKSARVYGDDPERPTVRLQMTGMVNTVVEKATRVQKIHGPPGARARSVDVELTPASDLAYRLGDVRVEKGLARVQDWETLDEPGHYRVHLELTPTDLSSRFFPVDLIYGLALDDGRYWECRRKVIVNYLPLVEVSKKTVYFRRKDSAEDVERSLRVMSSAEWIRFRIRDIAFEDPDDESSEIFDVWWETTDPGREYAVHVRRNERGAGSKTLCKLVIHTDRAEESTKVVKVISFN